MGDPTPPHLLTFELESLAEQPLTADNFDRLLGGLRHEVAYVREGALYGCEPHMTSLALREQVRVLAEHDEDEDIREIAMQVLEGWADD